VLSEERVRSGGIYDMKDETQIGVLWPGEQMAMVSELVLKLAAKAAIPNWLVRRILEGESQEYPFLSSAGGAVCWNPSRPPGSARLLDSQIVATANYHGIPQME
jgi:hypothetical protein